MFLESVPVQIFVTCVISPNRLAIKISLKNEEKTKFKAYTDAMLHVGTRCKHESAASLNWLLPPPLSFSHPVNSLNSHTLKTTCFIKASILVWQDSSASKGTCCQT